MTILVTGAAGFVGTALVKALSARGDHVVAIDHVAGSLQAMDRVKLLVGDIGDDGLLDEAMAGGVDAVVHLATVPGGAAEADPAASKRVNIDAMHEILVRTTRSSHRPRFVYASSIAVFGDPLPPEGVDDATPLAPRMIYGGHKAMMELEVAMMSRRQEIDGVTVRLSGILARPAGPSGMKSAFMSDIFHALRGCRAFVSPVSEQAALWVQSVPRCVDNLLHALTLDSISLPESRAVTLPAVRVTMEDLAAEICRQTGASPSLVSYAPDERLERAFGRHPALRTTAAEQAGFEGDGSIAALVGAALAQIACNEA